jgi:hypothetical protein
MRSWSFQGKETSELLNKNDGPTNITKAANSAARAKKSESHRINVMPFVQVDSCQILIKQPVYDNKYTGSVGIIALLETDITFILNKAS